MSLPAATASKESKSLKLLAEYFGDNAFIGAQATIIDALEAVLA